MENKQGSTLLKVVSIILIVVGSIGLVAALLSIASIAALIYLGVGKAILYVALVFTIITAVLEFVSGIIGTINWAKPEKAKTCKTLGIMMIICEVLAIIINIVGGQSFGSIAFGAIAGTVLPVLYFIGAQQLEKLQ
jgi:hypothetical protein